MDSMKMKHKFKIGDKIVIAKFPMSMISGNADIIKQWMDAGTVFIIRSVYDAENVYVDFADGSDSRWYLALDGIALAKGYKPAKKIASWSL